jgi:TP901 family phage tail tape measure protein
MGGRFVASRDLTVRIDGDPSGFNRATKSAQASASAFERELKKLEAQQAKQQQAMSDLGKAGLAVGAAAAAGMGLAVRAAVSWESAWAGVTKTVDGTTSQMGILEGQLRELAKTLPASHTEIAAVAEAAGQLGIKREDVAKFTETMIALGETTNLTADEAATSLARMSNIMGTSADDVDRMGATIVELGNNAATTEAEIVTLATRMAAAGKQAGLSEADVLAFASTLTSVGVEAEAGGTAMSKVFTAVADAMRDGNERLGTFAKVAGMSSREFAQAYGEDAAGAITSFTEGLGRMSAAGESTTHVFDDLSLTDQRLMRALLSTASAGELLREQITLGNGAWEANSALVAEATKRYETTESQIRIARNAINDAAIDIGAVLLPMLAKTAGAVADLAGFFGDLPEPVQTAVAILGTLTAVVGLVGGAALIAAPKILAMKASLEALNVSARTTSRAMTAMSVAMKGGVIAAGLAGIAVAATQVADALAKSGPGLGSMTDALADFGRTGQVSGALAEVVGDNFQSLAGKIENANKNIVARSLSDSVRSDINALESLDQTLASLVQSGNPDVAAKAFAEIRRNAGDLSDEDLAGTFDAYGEALAGAAADAKLNASATRDAAGASGELGDAATEAANALKEQADALRAQYDPVFAMQKAIGDHREAQIALAEAVKEHGRGSQEATEAEWALFEATVGLSGASNTLAGAMQDGTTSVAASKEQLQQWVRQGLISQEQANTLAGGLKNVTDKANTLSGTPAKVRVSETGVAAASEALTAVQRKMEGLDGRVANVTVRYSSMGADRIVGVGGGIQRASGGYVSGPGTDTSDSIPARLSNGEYVLRAAAVRRIGVSELDQMNRGYAQGGLVRGYAAGGAVSPTMQVSLTTAVRGLTNISAIQRLVQAWQDYNRELEQAARKRELVAAAYDAQAQLRAAQTTEERARAQEQLNRANQAVREFDYAAEREREAAAVQRMIDKLEEQARAEQELTAARRREQDNRYEVGVLSEQDYLRILEQRMATERQYTDAWMALWRERERILERQADAERELTDTLKAELNERIDAQRKAVEDRARAQQNALDRLNSLLDAEQDLRNRHASFVADNTEAQQAVQARQVQAEADYYTRRAALGRQFNDEQQRLLDTRRAALVNGTALDQQIAFRRGLPADWLIGNAQRQIEAFTEWMHELDAARRMGVSESVIEALGLDEGPQALAQVRALTRATSDEIEALNRAVQDRTRLAGEQVAREQQNRYGQLGRDLVAAQERYAAELNALELQFLAEQADLARQLTTLQEQLKAAQQQLAVDLAALGQEQGRSYSDAIAAGIRSGLPGILSAVDAARQAMADLKAAQDALNTIAPPLPTGAALPGAPGSPFKRPGARTRTYDSGGWLMPGYTLAYNGTGQPERVLTAQQFSSTQRTVNVMPGAQVTVRETVDVDLLVQRAEFLISTGSLG